MIERLWTGRYGRKAVDGCDDGEEHVLTEWDTGEREGKEDVHSTAHPVNK